MAPVPALDSLSNSLASPEQLFAFKQVDDEKNQSLRFAWYQIISAAGILLRLPQEIIAQAIVLLQRLEVVGHPQPAYDVREHCATCTFLAAKPSPTPISWRSLANVYAYLGSHASPLKFINPDGPPTDVNPQEYYVTEGSLQRHINDMVTAEGELLQSIGFDTRVVLPHGLALTYMQALGVSSATLARSVLEHLNAGLLSPQMLYLTHQPNALAVGAIYLAARELGVKLVEQNWWEVFDVDREDLGFLVMAYGSMSNFAEAEMEKWKNPALTPIKPFARAPIRP
ncbi:hypothetical protein LTR10_015207 [Elasticomyces elasticus]|uniref:Cyclin domain-containing protein n=1 Tax=Exophiala sideris TaxID=1016849 RepID=A0ABR0JE44_9EURO|nr:hypothetical protein LTR10_015207 [Elasticomyces elasticus]KAK5032681.1 hypothetical protein LTS07_004091 [Exophiala sideris]KAK5037138.1 hypothetical protein LTR13_004943 [Exophiala sideris]KAK5062206.1 hypothetical protein LTR69_004564 [Exophiala sideris]KAK5182296.1 hypothetical protein LTR44_005307 [Eurotiomycetes sp. CCFEE 6388]